jgi:hypothetical protein
MTSPFFTRCIRYRKRQKIKCDTDHARLNRENACDSWLQAPHGVFAHHHHADASTRPELSSSIVREMALSADLPSVGVGALPHESSRANNGAFVQRVGG